MMMSFNAAQSMLHRWRNRGWILLATALVSFAAGSLFTARLAGPKQVSADSGHVFELMICQAANQIQSKRGRLLGTQRRPCLERHVRLPRRPSQPKGSGCKLASPSCRPRVSALSQIGGATD